MTAYDPAVYQRARAKGSRAIDALRLARWIATPRLDIEPGHTTTIERDGFTLHIRVTTDEYIGLSDLGYGSIEEGTEDWRTGYYHPSTPGAIPINRDRSRSGRYYVPANDIGPQVDYYHKHGASRSVALDMARADQYDEMRRATEEYGPEVYNLDVTATRAGIDLGSASTGGIEVGWDDVTRTSGYEYFDEVAQDLIPEAIDEARKALTRLEVAV